MYESGPGGCSFVELFNEMAREDPRVAASGREAVERSLNALQADNKLMYREGLVHLI